MSKYFNFERRPDVCGDYLMTAGELTFLPQEYDQTIRVEIMDDFCNERYSEFFRVQLFLIGGPALIGEKYDIVVKLTMMTLDMSPISSVSIIVRPRT